MARKPKHEDHLNHEAWAIPYGDLLTLLLAFFVVMYSMSSVNEGKYRVLSDSLVAAFRGAPKTIVPIEIGRNSKGSSVDTSRSLASGIMPPVIQKVMPEFQEQPRFEKPAEGRQGLGALATRIEDALKDLIEKDLVTVHRESMWVEIEIRTDILFASGDATIADSALPPLRELATILADFPNLIRVEGHTDNVPIYNRNFKSNWELSAARAASVVYLFKQLKVDPSRLEIIGLGEYRPVANNGSDEGRNQNRRVAVVVLEQLDGSSRDVSAQRAHRRDQAQTPEQFRDGHSSEKIPGSGEAASGGEMAHAAD